MIKWFRTSRLSIKNSLCGGPSRRPAASIATRLPGVRKVDVRLPGKGDSNSYGASPVHLIITMITWIRTSRLTIKNSLSLSGGSGISTESDEMPRGRPVALASRERKLLTFCCPFGDHDFRRSHSLMLPAGWGSGFRVQGSGFRPFGDHDFRRSHSLMLPADEKDLILA